MLGSARDSKENNITPLPPLGRHNKHIKHFRESWLLKQATVLDKIEVTDHNLESKGQRGSTAPRKKLPDQAEGQD